MVRRRTLVAYAVDDDTRDVVIVGIFHGGQDFEADLREES